MSATDAFSAAWRQVTRRKPIALVEIVAQGITVHVATDPITIANMVFDPLVVGGGSIRSRGSFLGSTVALPSASFTIGDGPSSAAGGARFTTLLSAHQFVGARVTIWLWERTLTDFADALQRFTGVVQTYSVNGAGINFTCLAGRSFNRSIVPAVVTREKYPQAPDASVGVPLPTYYGRVQAPPMRDPWADGYGLPQRARELISGGRRTGRAVLVDTGLGTANAAKVVVAGHPCYQIGNLSPSYLGGGVFMDSRDGKRVALEIASGNFFNNAIDGAGFTIADNSAVGRYPFFPQKWTGTRQVASVGYPDVGPPSHTNTLVDPESEYNYVRMCGGGFNYVTLTGTFSGGGDQGTITLLTLYVGLRVVAGSVTALTWALRLPTGASFATGTFYDPSPQDLTKPCVYSFTVAIAGTVPTTLADVSGCSLRLISSGTVADVFFAGVSASYIPDQNIVDSNTHVLVTPMPQPFNSPFPAGTSDAVVNTYRDKQMTSNSYEVIGTFYANVSGLFDTTPATYTGTNGALIERVPDVVRHMLAVYGGVPLADIVDEAGWGSFTDARSALLTRNGADMVLGFSFAQEMQITSLLSWIMAASASEVWPSSSDGRWRILPWSPAPAVSRPALLTRADVIDPENGVATDLTPDSDVLSALVINYGRDEAAGSYAHAVTASASNSCAGHLYHSMRDGSLEIVAGVNDAIDVQSVLSSFLPEATAYIAPGVYTVETMTTELARLFATPETTFTVTLGVNDDLDIEWSPGVVASWKITPGTRTRAQWYTDLNGWFHTVVTPGSNFGVVDGPIGPVYSRSYVNVTYTSYFKFRWDLHASTNARALFGFSKAEAIEARNVAGSSGSTVLNACGWSVGYPATTVPLTPFVSPTVNAVGFNGVVVAGANDTIYWGVDYVEVATTNQNIVVQTTAGGATATAVLVPGWYDRVALAAEAQRAIRVYIPTAVVTFNETTATNGARVFSWQATAGMALRWADTTNSAENLFGWLHVSSGFVTTLFYSTYTVESQPTNGQHSSQLSAGTYTMDGLAAELQRVLQPSIPAFGVSFDHATRKFTIACDYHVPLWFAFNRPRSVAALFGFATRVYKMSGPINAQTLTGVRCGVEGQLAIATTGDRASILQWYSGFWHGLASIASTAKTVAATVLGFDWQQDDEGGEIATLTLWGTSPLFPTTARILHTAVAPKVLLEGVLAAADAIYGKKVPVQIDGRCINDTNTALELRSRLVTLLTGPRGLVSFSSETLPDMERGQTFQFSSDMDQHRPYCVGGTDGSWAGKTFRVIEEEQRFGDSWHSDFVAVDVTN